VYDFGMSIISLNSSRLTISKWENNRTLPDIENLILLSKYFNTNLLEIADVAINEKDIRNKNKSNQIKKILKYCTYFFIGVIVTTAITFTYNIYNTYYRYPEKTIELVGFSGIVIDNKKTFLVDMNERELEFNNYNEFVKLVIFNKKGTVNSKKANNEQLNTEVTKNDVEKYIKENKESSRLDDF